WLLLTPYFEASNFLLHLDTRTRQEGLDLFFRVRRLFPLNGKQLAGGLLAVTAGLLFVAPAAARNVVESARASVRRIADEVRRVNPYPGSGQYVPALTEIAERLENEGDKARFAWFRRHLKGFAQLDRDAALAVLADLDRRLARSDGEAAQSKDDLRKLLRPPREGEEEPSPARRGETPPQRREREDPPEIQREGDAPTRRSTPGTSGPATEGGGNGGLMLVGGLLLALLLATLILWMRTRTPAPVKARVMAEGKAAPRNELPRPDETPASALWRRAEELAARGDYLEALRALYTAVLGLLHQRRWVRYEPTRTNGEYVE